MRARRGQPNGNGTTSRTHPGFLRAGRARLRLVGEPGDPSAGESEGPVGDDRRIVIGPIDEPSPSTAWRLREMLQRVVDDAWSSGQARVVEVDLTVAVIRRPDIRAVLADVAEELRAIGGRLVPVTAW
ncbi:MAG TPA: hypothetical protein VHT75_15265 [Acidimicrobiales bacterium]|nr:hypothetical protein [Acidimicrobiales bacterium]